MRKISEWIGVVGCLVLLVYALTTRATASYGTPWHRSIATQYASKVIGDPLVRVSYDKQAGSHFACGGGKMSALRWGIAHRKLRCGSLVEICKGSLCVTAPVVDRGPYWACKVEHKKRSIGCWRSGKAIVRSELAYASGWHFANDLDLLPRVAYAIRLNGRSHIRWRVLYIPKGRR